MKKSIIALLKSLNVKYEYIKATDPQIEDDSIKIDERVSIQIGKGYASFIVDCGDGKIGFTDISSAQDLKLRLYEENVISDTKYFNN